MQFLDTTQNMGQKYWKNQGSGIVLYKHENYTFTRMEKWTQTTKNLESLAC